MFDSSLFRQLERNNAFEPAGIQESIFKHIMPPEMRILNDMSEDDLALGAPQGYMPPVHIHH